MGSPGVPDPVYAEQVRSSYAHLPLTLSVSVLNSVLLGFVLASDISHARILIWIGLVWGLSALRLALWYVHRHRDVGPGHNRCWTQFATGGALASEILWGGGSVFAPLEDPCRCFFWPW